MRVEDMTPRQAYEVGYANGESSLLADVATLCEQIDIDLEGHESEFDAIRAAVQGAHDLLRRVLKAFDDELSVGGRVPFDPGEIREFLSS